jgi:hypothetical protein
MKPTSTRTSGTASLAIALAVGAAGGGVLILLSWWLVLSWWLLTSVAHPATASDWWDYPLVATYLLAPAWAPLLASFATLRLAARFGWAASHRA